MSILVKAAVLVLTMAGSAGAQSEIDTLLSPWGTKDKIGIDPIGETLLSPIDRETLELNLYKQELLSGVVAQENAGPSRVEGYVYRFGGYTVTGASAAVGGVVATAGAPATFGTSFYLGAGIITVGGAAGSGLTDYGETLLDEANKTVSARLALYLHDKYGDIVRPNNTLNESRLRQIGDSELFKAIDSDEFRTKVPDVSLLVDLKTTAIVDMLQLGLKDNQELKLGVTKLDEKLTVLDKGVQQVRRIQERSLRQIQANGVVLNSIEGTVDGTKNLVTQLIASNMPPSKVLALYESGALSLKPEAVAALQITADAIALKKQFDDAASVFNSTATVMQAIGIDDDLVKATVSIGSLLTSGGAFAAAVTIGEPLSIFNTGAALFGNIGGVFGKKKGDPTGKALQAIMRQIQALGEQIQKNHEQQMEALRRISLKLDELNDTLNRRFAELGLDVSLIMLDTRELLYEDVRVCERLVGEFKLPETQAVLRRAGLVGFSIWFEADNRVSDFGRCLNGLAARQRVASERDFSGMLRADTAEESGGSSVDERRRAVRRVEQRVLQPTSDYIRSIAKEESDAIIASRLYQKFFTLCDVITRFGELDSLKCGYQAGKDWVSRIDRSLYNPGQGTLLSANTALLLSNFTRTIAPWNGILIERTTGGTSRVMTEQEARTYPRQGASRRTRHLLTINNAVDTLDLNVGQANIVAGVPALFNAAKVLDEMIVPAYAEARRLDRPQYLNKLLAVGFPSRQLPGPDCTRGSKAWNTLCLMETNPVFAKNVVRMFIALRLHRKGVSFDQWRSAIRSPFSMTMQDLIGADVFILDAAEGVPENNLGLWAFEFPKVFFDPDIELKSDGNIPAETGCWTPGALPALANERGEFDENAIVYTKRTSSRCHMIDQYNIPDFEKLELATGYSALVNERILMDGLRDRLCVSNQYYPNRYCHRSSQTEVRPEGPADAELVSTARN